MFSIYFGFVFIQLIFWWSTLTFTYQRLEISFKELEITIFNQLPLIASVSLKRPAQRIAKDQNLISTPYPNSDRKRIKRKYTREDSFSETANYAKTDFVQTGAFLSKLLHMVIIA